jgi:hypothetical protein
LASSPTVFSLSKDPRRYSARSGTHCDPISFAGNVVCPFHLESQLWRHFDQIESRRSAVAAVVDSTTERPDSLRPAELQTLRPEEDLHRIPFSKILRGDSRPKDRLAVGIGEIQLDLSVSPPTAKARRPAPWCRTATLSPTSNASSCS